MEKKRRMSGGNPFAWREQGLKPGLRGSKNPFHVRAQREKGGEVGAKKKV